MKFIEGNKYIIKFKWGTVKAFYCGECDSFQGQTCACCDKRAERGYLFQIPSNDNTTYKECQNGAFREQLPIGRTCIKKLEIIPV